MLSKATSETVKAKISLEQLLGDSPNKQFVEYNKRYDNVDLTKTKATAETYEEPAIGTNGLPDDEATQIY